MVYIAPITNIPYAHGSFFGVAPFFLYDPVWRDILRQLMPDVYCEVSKMINAPIPRLMHWAENNPIVAAYGLTCEKTSSGRTVTLEWDVFLDPSIVKRMDRALTELDSIDQNLPDFLKEQEALKTRIKVLSSNLLGKMLIAHGSILQLAREQLGFAKHRNFSKVKRTRRTRGGGVRVEQWLLTFADALKLLESKNAALEQTELVTLGDEISFQRSGSCSNSMADSVRIINELLKHPLSVILDLKSRYISKRVWARLIDELRDCGVRVEGAASFFVREIRGINEYTSIHVPEVFFFHSAGHLQDACCKGIIKKNDTVYFNAGSLLSSRKRNKKNVKTWDKKVSRVDTEVTQQRYTLRPFAFFKKYRDAEQVNSCPNFPHHHYHFPSIGPSSSTIEDYKEAYELSIGVYSQEYATDEVAADLLFRFVNENSNVFDLGFSWGGINGVTVKGIRPRGFKKTDGLGSQRLIGKKWNPYICPIKSETS
eukprot:CAMPEP_0194281288 /NCGR_PEP_ID=MMETSP0169-20130528/20438_1 /TAXON_ID=218684 /ORGANISM="Corethron pennatum, Strain L29A3" /LENGTH=481 /DNA_ID=CAMNT_0039026307 /DNA_START=216 /DNA_END=1661 /DNA_ORIENTATION=-